MGRSTGRRGGGGEGRGEGGGRGDLQEVLPNLPYDGRNDEIITSEEPGAILTREGGCGGGRERERERERERLTDRGAELERERERDRDRDREGGRQGGSERERETERQRDRERANKAALSHASCSQVKHSHFKTTTDHPNTLPTREYQQVLPTERVASVLAPHTASVAARTGRTVQRPAAARTVRLLCCHRADISACCLFFLTAKPPFHPSPFRFLLSFFFFFFF